MSRSIKERLHFHISVERQAQRFRELIIYVSKKCEGDVSFGAVKLNKILYHSDFRAFERFGVPLTGVTYFRIQNGPAPKAMVPVRDILLSEGAIRIDMVPIGKFRQERPVALRPAVTSHFSDDELLLVDEVIADLWAQNATEVSDASHDVRWRTLQHKDSMPYEFAFLDGDLTETDHARTAELAQMFGW